MIKLPFVRRVRRLINTGLIAHPPYGYDDKIIFKIFFSPRQRQIPQMAQRVRPPQAVCRVAKPFAATRRQCRRLWLMPAASLRTVLVVVTVRYMSAGHVETRRLKALIRCNKMVIDHDDRIPLSPSHEMYECSIFTASGIMPPVTRRTNTVVYWQPGCPHIFEIQS